MGDLEQRSGRHFDDLGRDHSRQRLRQPRHEHDEIDRGLPPLLRTDEHAVLDRCKFGLLDQFRELGFQHANHVIERPDVFLFPI